MQYTHHLNEAIAQLAGAHILLVEDNKLNRELASEILRLNGLRVSSVWNGEEALSHMKTQTFDGILMDIQMPVMDGYTTTLAIREQPQYKNLPIIAMTGNNQQADRDQEQAVGINDYVNKPLKVNNLFITLAKWINLPPSHDNESTIDHITPFAHIVGINTEQGLATTLGNTDLYRQLLRFFYQELQLFIENVQQAQKKMDITEATRIAHTLKNTAETIGANSISRCALALETACQSQQEQHTIDAMLDAIHTEIIPVAKSLEAFIHPTTPPTIDSNNQQKNSPYTKRAETTERNETLAVKQLVKALALESTAGIIFFCSSHYHLDSLAEAFSQSIDCPIMGCTSAGEIASTYQKKGIVAVSLSAEVFRLHTHLIEPLNQFNHYSAQQLAQRAESQLEFSTSLNKNNMIGFLLIDGLSLLEENTTATLYHTLKGVSIIGGSAGDNLQFKKTCIYAHGRFQSNAAVLGLIETKLPFRTFKLQHLMPSDKELVITESNTEKRMVYEINGEVAAAAYAKTIGITPKQLTPDIFFTHPLMLEIGDEWYVRAIKEMKADGSLSFMCAIDDGLPLTIGQGMSLVDNLRQQIHPLQQAFQHIELTLGCDCILRRLEIEKHRDRRHIEKLLEPINFLGFSTFGEQYNAIHVNQTLTGIVFGHSKEH